MAKFSFNTDNRLQFYISEDLGNNLKEISIQTFLNYTQILNRILIIELDCFNIEEYKEMLELVKDKTEDKIRVHGYIRNDLFDKFMKICRENKIPKSKLMRYFIIKTIKKDTEKSFLKAL